MELRKRFDRAPVWVRGQIRRAWSRAAAEPKRGTGEPRRHQTSSFGSVPVAGCQNRPG